MTARGAIVASPLAHATDAMPNTLVIHAHPHPRRSLVTQRLRRVFDNAPDTTVRSLYELYPDFDIDATAEREALAGAQLVVWLTPIHWYSVPSLMKHWFDQVLVHGWAYGDGGNALRGKTVWWVASAGASASAYAPGGEHGRPFADFIAPIEQTARYCGMHWLPPYVVHAGHMVSDAEREASCAPLVQHLQAHRSALALSTAEGAAA